MAATWPVFQGCRHPQAEREGGLTPSHPPSFLSIRLSQTGPHKAQPSAASIPQDSSPPHGLGRALLPRDPSPAAGRPGRVRAGARPALIPH